MSSDLMQWIEDFKSGDLETRRFAAEQLAQAKVMSKDAVKILVCHLSAENEPSEHVREWCIYTLGKHRCKGANDALIKTLKKDKVKDVRIMAARAMGRIGSSEFAAPLKKRLNSSTDAIEKRHICLALLDAVAVNPKEPAFTQTLKSAIRSKAVPETITVRVDRTLAKLSKDGPKPEHADLVQLDLIDSQTLDDMVKPKPNRLLQMDISRKDTILVSRYERNQLIKKKLLKERGRVCQLCGQKPFITRTGEKYAEVHHIQPLSKFGKDIPDNMLVVCPTCHKKLHYVDSIALFDPNQRRCVSIKMDARTIKIRWQNCWEQEPSKLASNIL